MGKSRTVKEPKRQSGKSGRLQDVSNTESQRRKSFKARPAIVQLPQGQGLYGRGSNAAGIRRNGQQWQSEPDVGRVVAGVSRRVDRLKGRGNAIVPQVAFEIFKAIDFYEQSEYENA